MVHGYPFRYMERCEAVDALAEQLDYLRIHAAVAACESVSNVAVAEVLGDIGARMRRSLEDLFETSTQTPPPSKTTADSDDGDDSPRDAPDPPLPLASRAAALDRALARIADVDADGRCGYDDEGEFDDLRAAFEDVLGIATRAATEDDAVDANCEDDRACADRFRVLVDAIRSIALAGLDFLRDQKKGPGLHRDARKFLDGIRAIAWDDRHRCVSGA